MRETPVWLNATLVVITSVILALPLSGWVNGIQPQLGEEENRIPASFPEWQFKKAYIKRIPDSFGKWFADHMAWRPTLVKSHDLINRHWLDSHDSVVAGKNDWLFLLREPRRNNVAPTIPADYCGRNPFSATQLEHWRKTLIENWQTLRRQGREYLLLIVPNKQTIYAEFFPDSIGCTPGQSRFDQLKQALLEEPDFPLLDLRELFLENPDPRLWYRTDTHWNGHGANLALDFILEHLNQTSEVELVNAIDTKRFSMRVKETRGWGLALMYGLGTSFVEKEPQIIPRTPLSQPLPNPFPNRTQNQQRQPKSYLQTETSLPDILVLHDSFIDQRIKRLMTDSFARSTFVWHRGRPNLDIESNVINALQPDIVLHEMVERNLLHDYY